MTLCKHRVGPTATKTRKASKHKSHTCCDGELSFAKTQAQTFAAHKTYPTFTQQKTHCGYLIYSAVLSNSTLEGGRLSKLPPNFESLCIFASSLSFQHKLWDQVLASILSDLRPLEDPRNGAVSTNRCRGGEFSSCAQSCTLYNSSIHPLIVSVLHPY